MGCPFLVILSASDDEENGPFLAGNDLDNTIGIQLMLIQHSGPRLSFSAVKIMMINFGGHLGESAFLSLLSVGEHSW